MVLFKSTDSLKQFVSKQRKASKSIGYVPTMGALHDGHKSLIEGSKQACDITICSIFVNPTQFNDPADFAKYPKTLPDDILMLERINCDVLFIPDVIEMYPTGLITQNTWALGKLENIWEGEYRPGHFKGVSQIVYRLLASVEPDIIYLGQKDIQQVRIITKLVKQLFENVNIHIVPTLREPTGLALSSRNRRLDPQQRNAASALYESLLKVKQEFKQRNFTELEDECKQFLLNRGFESIDYFKIVDDIDLEPVADWDGKSHLIAITAATIGGTRLIDNLSLTP